MIGSKIHLQLFPEVWHDIRIQILKLLKRNIKVLDFLSSFLNILVSNFSGVLRMDKQINRYKNKIRAPWGWKPRNNKNAEPDQNVTGSLN